MKVFWIVIGSIFGLAALTSGSIPGFVVVGGLSGLFFWLAFRKRKPSQQNNPSDSQRDSRASKPLANGKPSKPKKPSYPPTAENAARRLRAIATAYDNPREQMILRIDNLVVTRVTTSTNVSGPGTLILLRDGIHVGFYNANARQPKLKEYRKPWSQTIGVVPNRFDLYLKDHSSFEFAPHNAEDFLVLSAFWQVFHEAMNGYHELIRNPEQSGLGDRLRQAATYIDSHRAECANGAFDAEAALGEAEAVVVERQSDTFTFRDIGSVIEGWRLTKRLGAGGFGEVFLAENVDDPSELAAVKLMKIDKRVTPGSPEFMHHAELFLNEGQRSMNFGDSAYVLSCTGLGLRPWPWIRYPFIRGSTAQQLTYDGKLTWGDWWNLAHDLLSGLDAIHSEGLVHKDIKQDNVMQTSDRFVVLDLGISVVSGYENTGGMGFYPPHLSAEILESDKSDKQSSWAEFSPSLETFSPKSDVFAAGLTLYWCVKGQNPWPFLDTDSSAAARLNHMRTQPVNFDGLPSDVAHLLRQMLELNPKKRPTARTLLFEIEPHIDIEQKLRQIDDAWENWLARTSSSDAYDGPAEEGMFGADEPGPFETWEPLEKMIHQTVAELRPTWFTITLGFFDSRELVFVQAMYASEGWQAECSADVYKDVALTEGEKQRFVGLGWSPPTSSDPNFSRNIDGIDPATLQNVFIAAIEQGYRITPGEIKNLSLKAQDRGAY